MRPRLAILIPVFNDWEVAALLLAHLDRVLVARQLSPEVVIVDDGSTAPVSERLLNLRPEAFQSLRIVHLRKNLGHQRALAVGLVYLHESGFDGATVVMDSDGEDSPDDVPVLLDCFFKLGQQPVFAERAKRAEGILFRCFYWLYRMTHWLLVGMHTRIGNFSVIPCPTLRQLVVSSDLWNHYAAATVRSRVPVATVPLNRAKRLGGKSRMGLAGLVVHGLSAMAVYGDTVGVRMLAASAAIGAITLLAIGLTIYVRFATSLAIAGWATYVTGLLLLIFFNSVMISLMFTFVILNSRGQSTFVPLRDCPVFIGLVRTLFERND